MVAARKAKQKGEPSSRRTRQAEKRRRRSRSVLACLNLVRLGAVLSVLIWASVSFFLLSNANSGDADAGTGANTEVASRRNALLRKRGGGTADDPAPAPAPAAAVIPDAQRPPREPHLLTAPSAPVTATASVRGNLGPPSVILNSGTDWIKDRWQAASDMGGTAIKGRHWVQLQFDHGGSGVVVTRIVLDWESAYCNDYSINVRGGGEEGEEKEPWRVLFDTSNPNDRVHRTVSTSGQSPGVKEKTPLHVVHDIDLLPSSLEALDGRVIRGVTDVSEPVEILRINMRRPAKGWGVSLWRVEVYGWERDPAIAAPESLKLGGGVETG